MKAQSRNKKGTKQAQKFFRKKWQKFCAKFRHNTAQKLHKKGTKQNTQKHKTSTTLAQNKHKKGTN
jgi:hypothetical protein